MDLKRIRRATLLIGVLCAFAGFVHWFLAPPAVLVVQPARGRAVSAVYATGTVEASVTVRVAPRVAGNLVELGADEGQEVMKGQLLARLEDRDLGFSLAELEAKARYAEQQLERNQTLFKRGFVTRDRVDQARADLDAARAATRRATESMSFMTLRAPVQGRIIKRDGEVGDFIPVNQTIFFLSKAGMPLRIEAEVDEEDIASVRPGKRVLVKADAFPERVFEARVSEITPKGDPIARNYRVRIGLPQDSPLMIGMTAETNIIVAERDNALLVPSTALRDGFVWLVRGDRLVKQPVDVGAKGLERTEILRGVTELDPIVVQPRDDFRAGDKVQAVTRSTTDSVSPHPSETRK